MGQTVNLLSFDFGGSNPSAPTKISRKFCARRVKACFRHSAQPKLAQKSITVDFCGNSSVDRALAFQAGGRGFESRFPLLCCFSSVVERILGKDEVPSSTLGSSSDRVANANSGPQSQIIRLVNGQTLADLF